MTQEAWGGERISTPPEEGGQIDYMTAPEPGTGLLPPLSPSFPRAFRKVEVSAAIPRGVSMARKRG